MSDSPFVLCARQELLLAIRSRWTQIFAVVFAVYLAGVQLTRRAGPGSFATAYRLGVKLLE